MFHFLEKIQKRGGEEYPTFRACLSSVRFLITVLQTRISAISDLGKIKLYLDTCGQQYTLLQKNFQNLTIFDSKLQILSRDEFNAIHSHEFSRIGAISEPTNEIQSFPQKNESTVLGQSKLVFGGLDLENIHSRPDAELFRLVKNMIARVSLKSRRVNSLNEEEIQILKMIIPEFVKIAKEREFSSKSPEIVEAIQILENRLSKLNEISQIPLLPKNNQEDQKS